MAGGSSPAIRPIGKSAVHRICSGQVIFDLSSAVKELVENSLDAGATTVEVTLRSYGEDSFTVADNGTGISPTNFQARIPPLLLSHLLLRSRDLVADRHVRFSGARSEAPHLQDLGLRRPRLRRHLRVPRGGAQLALRAGEADGRDEDQGRARRDAPGVRALGRGDQREEDGAAGRDRRDRREAVLHAAGPEQGVQQEHSEGVRESDLLAECELPHLISPCSFCGHFNLRKAHVCY